MSESIRTVTVFGANGPTGQLLTRRLLDAGHKVVAATRHPDTFPLTAPCLTVAGADATRPADVALAVRDSDAVVSVLGTKYSRGPITLYSEAARAIVTAMQENGIRRLVVTSSMATVHWRDPNMSWLERFLVEHVLRWIGATLYEDMQRMEDLVSASDLDWTIMRPLGLASMDPPTEYTVARDQISGTTDRPRRPRCRHHGTARSHRLPSRSGGRGHDQQDSQSREDDLARRNRTEFEIRTP